MDSKSFSKAGVSTDKKASTSVVQKSLVINPASVPNEVVPLPDLDLKTDENVPANPALSNADTINPVNPTSSEAAITDMSSPWAALFKGSKRLERKSKPFVHESGEAFVLIPNTVIEKNKKSW